MLPLFLSFSLSVCLCSRVPHTTISPFLYLPFYFFAATTICLYKQHLFPTTSAQIVYDFECVLCTSSSTAAVASLSLPLSLSAFVQGYTSHNNIAISLPTFYFFAATTKCLYERHLFPTSLPGRIIFRFVTTGLILCTPLYATN